MIRTQEYSINLVEGQGNKLDKKLSAKPELLQNATLVDDGVPKKRSGHDAKALTVINSATPISYGHKLESMDDQLMQWSKDGFYTWSSIINGWSKRSTGPSARLDKVKVKRASGSSRMSNLGAAQVGNGGVAEFEAVAYLENGSNQVILRDLQTGSIIDMQLGLSGIVRPIELDGRLGFIQLDAAGDIKFHAYIIGSTISVTPTTLDTGCGTVFDACVAGTSLILVSFNAAGNTLRYTVFNSSLVQTASNTASAPTGSFLALSGLSVAWDSFNSYAWITMAVDKGATNSFYSTAYSTAAVLTKAMVELADIGNNTPYNSCAIAASAATLTVFLDHATTPGSNLFQKVQKVLLTISTNVVASASDIALDCGLVSHPWLYNSIPTVWISRALDGLASSDAINSAYFAIDANKDVHARCLRGRATQNIPGITAVYEILGRPISTGNVVQFYLRELDILPEVDRLTRGQFTASLTTLTYQDLKSSKGVKVGNSLYIPGAVPMAFDGQVVYEIGMHHGPYMEAASAGGAIPAGTYQWKSVYEFYNNKGELVLSLPSEAKSVTLGVSSTVTWTIRTLKLGKMTGFTVQVALYRTAIAGEIFYRVGQTANNSAVSTITVVDNLIDATLQLAQTWYFPGEVLENEPPDPCDEFVIVKNRLFSVSKDRENIVQYSKEKDFNLEPGHNEFLRTVIEDSNYSVNEKLRATGVLDDKTIHFKDSSMFYVVGDGPNNSGEGEFSRPQLLSADVGCSNPRSIVCTPMGLMFQSAKGIYVITRSLEVQYIGADVEDYNAKQITGATLVDSKNLVVFTTLDGVALAYDYYFRQWSVFTNYVAQDLTLWQGKLAHLKSTGVVHVENTDYDDDGAFVPFKLITSWLKVKDLQNFGRARRMLLLGEYKSAHNLKISVAYDYEQFNWSTKTFVPLAGANYNIVAKPTLANIYAGTIDGVYQWDYHLEKQKCQALKFTIEDIDTGTSGESFTLTNMALEVGLKSGPYKTQASKKG